MALDETTDLPSTSQRLVFIHGVNEGFHITEEWTSVCSLQGITTGNYILIGVQKALKNCCREWDKLRCLAVDKRKIMVGRRKDAVGEIRSHSEDLQIPNAPFTHCIIHQQTLCGKELNISFVLKPVVPAGKFIQSYGLNHLQIQTIREEILFHFCDLSYHTAVRWRLFTSSETK